MALQVIGAGLGRTGTFTLKQALEQLGFGPCHHMTEVIANPGQAEFWNRAARGETVDWEEVYGSYRATVDWPGAAFWRELAARYPQAKVVLSQRDPGRWYDSMAETILKSMELMGLSGPEVPEDHPSYFGGVLIAQRLFGFDYSRDNVIAAFERHNAAVREGIAPERLLEFDMAMGWGPLCEFLEVPVPDAPFPRTNARDEFWEHAARAREVLRD